jgi:hypothetical protein
MTTPEFIKISEVLSGTPISCPFCTLQVYPGDKVNDWNFDPSTGVCEHTLFVATDSGFEYRSSLFNQHMALADNQESEPDLKKGTEDDFEGYDHFTSKVSLSGSVKFASYAGAPSFFGVYYGFAPR